LGPTQKLEILSATPNLTADLRTLMDFTFAKIYLFRKKPPKIRDFIETLKSEYDIGVHEKLFN
jgi:hypothetical protein